LSFGFEKLRNCETKKSSMASEVDGWYNMGTLSCPLSEWRLWTMAVAGSTSRDEEAGPSEGPLELPDGVAVLGATEVLRIFLGRLSSGVPARSRGNAASGVISIIVTPRTGPEQGRPNRRHCRQKSPVSSHCVPVSAW
jgi:hypothetical protein